MELVRDAEACEAVDSNWCDLVANLTGNDRLALAAEWLVGKPVAILGILLLALVIRWLLHRLTDRLTDRASEGVPTGLFRRGRVAREEQPGLPVAAAAASRRVQRAKTTGTLLKSLVTGIVFAVAGVMAIAELGFNVAPIIAGAGILGLAVGFGAQSLVKDFLSGVFMFFEDQYGVGDVVDLGDAVGTVEAVSLRVTRLRDLNGTVWYVRNGEILRVGNMSQNWARTVLDVSVAYGEDLPRVRKVLLDVAHDFWADEEFRDVIIEEPEVWGVEQLGADGVVLRVALKTAPLEQWRVARVLRERIKARFDHEGIEIPFPQRVVWHREAPATAAPGAE